MLSPEKAHHLTTTLFSTLSNIPILGSATRRFYAFEDASLEKEVFGLKFKNPIGLAAGFDKDGKYYHTMSRLGFGFIEIGTVTPLPQVGNPQPRLFRYPRIEDLSTEWASIMKAWMRWSQDSNLEPEERSL